MAAGRIIHLVAGLVVLSIAMAHFSKPVWFGLAAFVGASLAQGGVTGFCLMAFMLQKAGVRDGSCCA